MYGAQTVQGYLGKIVVVFERMHGPMHVLGVCAARLFETHGSDGRSAPLFETPRSVVHGARLVWIVLSWRLARIFVTHGSDGCPAPLFVAHGLVRRCGRDAWLGYSLCTARLVVVHDLVGMRPRFDRDARIGCTRAKLYGHMIEPCGWILGMFTCN